MAKRFIDTGLFEDEWFMELSMEAKLAWVYLITNCDHAGIYKPNKKLFAFQTGIVTFDNIMKQLGNRLVTIPGGSFFIPNFIRFQYPNGLNFNKPAIISVKRILDKIGIVTELLDNSYLTIKDKDKDTNKDTDTDIDTDEGGMGETKPETPPQEYKPEPPPLPPPTTITSKIEAEFPKMDSRAVAIAKSLILARKSHEELFDLFTRAYAQMGHEVTETKHGSQFYRLQELTVIATADIQARAEANTVPQTPQNYLTPYNGIYGWHKDIHRKKPNGPESKTVSENGKTVLKLKNLPRG